MPYKVYKNCSEADFQILKEKLLLLENSILKQFSDRLISSFKYGIEDVLAINLRVLPSNSICGNLAIMYEDKPGEKTFSVILVKTVDKNGFRYGVREVLKKDVSIELLENQIEDIARAH